MDVEFSPPQPAERARKRRAINACTNCRTSKVKCDGVRPSCQRCLRNDVQCEYYEGVKDPIVLRIEGLEAEVHAISSEMDDIRTHVSNLEVDRSDSSATGLTTSRALTLLDPLPPITAPATAAFEASSSHSLHILRDQMLVGDHAVGKGLITWDQAALWFQSFFSGSHNFVPIFCSRTDTMESVSTRSAFLFDAIVGIGCRAEEGFNSPIFRRLQMRLREHLSHALIYSPSTPSLEDIQAITIMASYSENGFILLAIALRFAMNLGLSNAVEELLSRMSRRSSDTDANERELYRIARVWYGICNLELFFSLDGGKVPSITLRASSRRIRALVKHPESTAADVRLLSQIELNIIRSNAYNAIINHNGADALERETILRGTVNETTVELSLWVEEWAAIVSAESTSRTSPLALLNLQIQYEWAVITLHLKALSDSGIENIALMDEFQQDMVRTAKDAAARHLHHLLQASAPPSPNVSQPERLQRSRPTYLTTFKWAMDYVWAKCAFSVLLVLKLALLLRDPPAVLMSLFRDAHQVLEELKNITVGRISYFQILQVSIEKCEGALNDHIAQRNGSNNGGSIGLNDEMGGGEETQAEKDFEGYVPSEFVFEWDFPGLNLRHIPLGWQDLFTDLDNVL
ncbi:hypothetical protein BDV96DRAFT_569214 [Lophiotrema nucula]|uniref:Zn(2)-C6 fungal-type domain-containing protein n=1 Tax=Lophiotrema nucula TaxID=690887 RepID=A0A6A5ZI53_9PLEO|nr:hypothetical protein BDV96DRAFT_569214 [Lophiotrema nucula]